MLNILKILNLFKTKKLQQFKRRFFKTRIKKRFFFQVPTEHGFFGNIFFQGSTKPDFFKQCLIKDQQNVNFSKSYLSSAYKTWILKRIFFKKSVKRGFKTYVLFKVLQNVFFGNNYSKKSKEINSLRRLFPAPAKPGF